jgi:hypothetical protein
MMLLEGQRRYTLPLSFVCERKEEVHLFIFSLSVNGNTTGIYASSIYLGMPSNVCMYMYTYIRMRVCMCTSTISSSFNNKVNEILDEFSLKEK